MNNFYTASNALRNVLKDVGFRSVTFGEFSQVDSKRKTMFPNVHIVPGPMRLGARVIAYQFRLTASDIVDFNKDDPTDSPDIYFGLDNTQDILSDLSIRLSNAVEQLARSPYLDNLVEVDVRPNIDPFQEKYENLLTGWTMELTINLPSDATIC